SSARYEPVIELETLIDKLSDFSTPRNSTLDLKANDIEKGSDLPPASDDVEDIVSETLAEIHEKQGKPNAAINVYKKLIERNQKRRNHYDQQITRLEELKRKQEE